MEGYSVGIAFLLALYGYFAILANLGPAWQFADPIVAGLFTGLIVGDVPLGLAIGGTLELMSLGCDVRRCYYSRLHDWCYRRYSCSCIV